MNQEIYEAAFVDELNKIAENKSKPNYKGAFGGALTGAITGSAVQGAKILSLYRQMKKDNLMGPIMKAQGGFRTVIRKGYIPTKLRKGLVVGAGVGALIGALIPKSNK